MSIMRGNTKKTVISLLLLLLVTSLLAGSPAMAAKKAKKSKKSQPLVVFVGSGIGKARLGMADAKAAQALGIKAAKQGKDNEYEGRVVYFKFYGKPAGGEYPLEMYSDTKHKVFMFSINSSAYPTAEGIRVGSSEEALVNAYGNRLNKEQGRISTHYTVGGRTGTDFYVKDGVVSQIIVRSY